MRNYIVLVLFCMMVVVGFFACGGGGGGGGTVVVSTVDNSKAIGTFTVMIMDGSGGFSIDYGTATLDGAGHATYASLVSTDTSTFDYTVTVPGNKITIDKTMVGTLNEAGNFLTAVDITSGGKTMLTGVKNASAYTDTSITFLGGQFENDVNSSGELFLLTTATPTAGIVSITDLVALSTSTTDYTIASNGTFTIHPADPDTFGAISEDKNIMIFGDAEVSVSPSLSTGFGLQLPGSGMTLASLNGTYRAYEFSDENVSGGPDFQAARYTLTFNGNGNGTYRIDKSSSGYTESGTFSYTMQSDGRFQIDNSMQGIALQDGSVIALFADSTSIAVDNRMSTMIGIKL